MVLLKPALTVFLICSFSLTTIIYADKCWVNRIRNTIQIATHEYTHHFPLLLFICLYITKIKLPTFKMIDCHQKALRHNTK